MSVATVATKAQIAEMFSALRSISDSSQAGSFPGVALPPFLRPRAIHPRDLDAHYSLATLPSMAGLRVLVTGAGTGIGRGVALMCAREGAQVALHYFHETEGAESAVRMINERGGNARAFAHDLSQERDIQALVDDANNFLGHVDVLVNNAGITANIPLDRVSRAQIERLYAVNVLAPHSLIRLLTPGMIERKSGHVVNFCSCHVRDIAAHHDVYASTKAAIATMTESLGAQLAGRGVRVNAIVPGWCLVENHFDSEPAGTDFLQAAEVVPLGYISTPWDIGQFVVDLVTRLHYFAGAVIPYTGGHGLISGGARGIEAPPASYFGSQYLS